MQSYRRTVLGPFWITANMIVFSLAMTLVYGALFGVPTREYAAYVVCGMIAWFWISALVTEGGNAFSAYAGYIKGMPVDKAQFVWAVAFKQVIVLAHNMLVYLALIPLGVVELNRQTLFFPLAFAIIFAVSIPVIAVLSIVYVRYRDVQRLVSSLIIIVLLITPVFWLPTTMTGWRLGLATYNPVFYLVEMIRGPLSGREIPGVYFVATGAMAAFFWAAGWLIYRRLQRFVIYWI